jgi:hypothetical protein
LSDIRGANGAASAVVIGIETSVATVAAMWSWPTSSAPRNRPPKRSYGLTRRNAITVEAWLTVRSTSTERADRHSRHEQPL